ncbi:transglycosylase SLT domain-containing protein [Vreelandella sedimenti]|uniref:transglycosylase SLT domain-containing protein n=1 Tax=Vreelandella sedimenti TaxID=2729618 RepID=UPI003530107A|tara:strand:+ start:3438 stop:3803 length:366 start_codon:yes stop_codon:yes gene_type:complete
MDTPLARFIDDAGQRQTLLTRIYPEARLAGLPPELVLALIQVESAFKADAITSAGAVGLMQIMPCWVSELWLYDCGVLPRYREWRLYPCASPLQWQPGRNLVPGGAGHAFLAGHLAAHKTR